MLFAAGKILTTDNYQTIIFKLHCELSNILLQQNEKKKNQVTLNALFIFLQLENKTIPKSSTQSFGGSLTHSLFNDSNITASYKIKLFPTLGGGEALLYSKSYLPLQLAISKLV